MSITVASESISAKLRKDEKSRFTAICDEIGTSPSNAIRMFVSAFNRRGGFPFDPSNPYGFNSETWPQWMMLQRVAISLAPIGRSRRQWLRSTRSRPCWS